jgi:hypothetical protein
LLNMDRKAEGILQQYKNGLHDFTSSRYGLMPRTRCHPFVVNSSLDFGDAEGRSQLILDLCNEVLNPELTTNMGTETTRNGPRDISSPDCKNPKHYSIIYRTGLLLLTTSSSTAGTIHSTIDIKRIHNWINILANGNRQGTHQ